MAISPSTVRRPPRWWPWFERLGLEVVARQDGPDGSVVHSAVRLGEVVLMVARADADYDTPAVRGRSVGSGLYLQVADVDALFAPYKSSVATPSTPRRALKS
jgi:uncharacterized glyoxalase superfamily protein PhnB